MTEKEIREGNNLIEEFMGPRDLPPYTLPDGQHLDQSYPVYHLDWNLLMLVSNKLRLKLLYNRQIRDIFIISASPVEKCALKDWPHLGLEGVFDINGSFLKVVDLVRWYNEHCR